MHIRHLVRACSVAPLLALAPPPASAWGDNCAHGADRSASIDTAGAEKIVVIGRAGDLRLRPVQGSVASGHGRACASSQQYLAQTDVKAARDGGIVRIYQTAPAKMWGIGMIYARVDLTVDLPTNLPIEVQDTSGDLEIDPGLRVTRIDDSSGDMVVRGVQGDIDIHDSSGDIHVEDTAGLVQITDSSGDVVVRNARAVRIPTDSSGDITIEHVAGDVTIDQDSSGDIRIADVGGNASVLADSSGDIQVSGVKGTVSVPRKHHD